jgi:uncharacterized protein YqeY
MELTLKQKINADYMSAFKAKNTVAKNLLSVIKGEIQTIEKNTGVENLPDSEVIKIITKTAKSLKEINTSYPSAQSAEELFIVESYLPTQMSESEIRTAVKDIIPSLGENLTHKEMGKVMGVFNSKYAGLADGKLVSKIVKEFLS